jgi:uncharacterized membrane protein YraQ (UPF0718 family)
VEALLGNFLKLFIESAPWLLLGFAVAGVIKALVPEDLLASQLGKPGLASTVKAALIGAPLPLCSCGVIPAAVGLRRSGASKSATTAFLISTPETGVDSVSVSYALLGPFMAVIRPVAAVASAIVAGVLVGRDNETLEQKEPTESNVAEDVCCSVSVQDPQQRVPWRQKLFDAWRFTFVDLVQDITKWLLIGLGCAALIQTFVPQEFLLQWGDGLLAFVVMAVIGVPMYICATASTPIAAGLLFSGVSPGAVLVFMLVGPATNIATVALVRRELGQRALYAYLGSVVGVGFAFGYLTNALAANWGLGFVAQPELSMAMSHGWIGYAAAAVLALLMLRSPLASLWRPATAS